MKKIKKATINSIFHLSIQIMFLLLFPSAFTAAFSGVKYIFTQIGLKKTIEVTSFVMILIGLCVYTIIFGRFFCGYACAFGALNDVVRSIYAGICKKRKKKPKSMNTKLVDKLLALKYVVLVAIIVMCYLSVYQNLSGTSPWDVFSMLQAGNFKLGSHIIGLIVLIVLVIGMIFEERFFCKFFCPMGAVFSILPVFPMFNLFRDRENCIKGCKTCERNCPANIELPESGKIAVSGDCIQCQKCIQVCPKKNIHTGIRRIKGNEIWFTAARVIILIGVFLWLGI
ncbi:MAG: 4Fe-4S binding protein [Suipraeoptans sp.]